IDDRVAALLRQARLSERCTHGGKQIRITRRIERRGRTPVISPRMCDVEGCRLIAIPGHDMRV
ncbi:MAG: hypothetical protein ACK55I_47910, partial [bacterium]